MSDNGVKFEAEHEFVANVNGNELTISRKILSSTQFCFTTNR